MSGNRINIGITGVEGLIGNHTRVLFHSDPHFKVFPCDREAFSDGDSLRDLVRRCDAIIHLAGMNRGDERVVAGTNIALNERLISAFRDTKSTPHVIFSSSTHIDRDTAYGQSKRDCAEKLARWAQESGAKFSNLILPNVFGEGGRPFYNSAVSTFCHQLACSLEPRIEVDAEIVLMHAGQVAELCRNVILECRVGEERPQGVKLRVSEVLQQLRELLALYRRNIIPDLSTPLGLELFNVLRFELFNSQKLIDLKLHSDDRGTLFEAVKTLHGGQSFVSTTNSGVTRGNHFHRKKLERFLVLSG